MKKNHRIVPLLLPIIFIISLIIGQIVSVSAAQQPPSPERIVQSAWALAQESDRYSYRADIAQTTYPAPRLTNAGKSPIEDRLALEGTVNLSARTMQMTLWNDGSYDPNTGIELKIEGDRAYGRFGQTEWQEVDNIADIFAPGGDPLAFLAGVTNIQVGETHAQNLNYTQYTFTLDGLAFARHIQQQLEARLREQGQLPAGLELSTSNLYRTMSGQGELWIGDDGLPLRLIIDAEFPPQDGNGRTAATITTDYYAFDHEQINAAAIRFFADPQTWISHRLSDVPAVQQAATNLVLLLIVVIVSLFAVLRWRSRRLYTAVILLIIISQLLTPLLQGQQVHAFYADQQEQQAAQNGRTAIAEQTQAIETSLQPDWNPSQNPLETVNSEQFEYTDPL
ncbi:MAG: hypothetical protein GY805_19990, partial [Chloroflexi bacterium]|nr:hypothetical protein [Chloroflexota bacterium]